MSGLNTPGPHVSEGEEWGVSQWNDLLVRFLQDKIDALNGIATNPDIRGGTIHDATATNLIVNGGTLTGVFLDGATIRPGPGGIGTDWTGPQGPPGTPGAPGPSVRSPTLSWEASAIVSAGSYVVTLGAATAGTVSEMIASAGTVTGVLTATVRINSAVVGGLNAVTVSSGAKQMFPASAPATVNVGDTITITLGIASGAPTGAAFTLWIV